MNFYELAMNSVDWLKEHFAMNSLIAVVFVFLIIVGITKMLKSAKAMSSYAKVSCFNVFMMFLGVVLLGYTSDHWLIEVDLIKHNPQALPNIGTGMTLLTGLFFLIIFGAFQLENLSKHGKM